MIVGVSHPSGTVIGGALAPSEVLLLENKYFLLLCHIQWCLNYQLNYMTYHWQVVVHLGTWLDVNLPLKLVFQLEDITVIFIFLPLFLWLSSRDTEIEYFFRSLIPSTRIISTDDSSALIGLLSSGSNSTLSRRDTMRQQITRRDIE